MAESTKEQLENAGKILMTNWDNISSQGLKDAAIDRIRRAVPYLQLPWDEPTESEISDAQADIRFTSEHQAAKVLFEFVRRRNAALLQKPVGPERAKIKEILLRRFQTTVGFEQAVEEIFQAFDKTI
jgi:hypothetical protein